MYDPMKITNRMTNMVPVFHKTIELNENVYMPLSQLSLCDIELFNNWELNAYGFKAIRSILRTQETSSLKQRQFTKILMDFLEKYKP